MQTNSVNSLPLAVAIGTGLVSYLEIRMSRPYKELKRKASQHESAKKLEKGLKVISLGTVTIALGFVIYRIIFS